jgi:transcriptional regulator with XRE-family HTH domain
MTKETGWTALRKQLTNARRAAGISQDAVARRLGFGRSSVSHIECGTVVPKIDYVVGYADLVQLQVALIPPQLARLMELELDDVVAIMRAARVAAQRKTLDPVEAFRVRESLGKVGVYIPGDLAPEGDQP